MIFNKGHGKTSGCYSNGSIVSNICYWRVEGQHKNIQMIHYNTPLLLTKWNNITFQFRSLFRWILNWTSSKRNWNVAYSPWQVKRWISKINWNKCWRKIVPYVMKLIIKMRRATIIMEDKRHLKGLINSSRYLIGHYFIQIM